MGRIRTIKPEFPHSETMGKVSRDARLTFILIWTIVDDSGRTRAASRMLASLLFPYDDDAPKLIPKWLDELEHVGAIRRYQHEGTHYIDIPKWLDHQKIDRPSQSKFPEFDESSRALDEPSLSRAHLLDQGPRTKEGIEDSAREIALCVPKKSSNGKHYHGTRLDPGWMCSPEDYKFATDVGIKDVSKTLDAFTDYWISQPGAKGVKVDWVATWRNWCRRQMEGFSR